jgi:hypothetical protein
MAAVNQWIAFSVVYNQEHFIRQWVENATHYADIALVMFSEQPWTYNPEARKIARPDRTGVILRELEQKYHNLVVIRGDWNDETGERNSAIKEAQRLGGKYLLIVDADEFFVISEVERAKQYIQHHPADGWSCAHIQFIKQPGWAIQTRDGLPRFEFAIDLKRVKKFLGKRIPQTKNILPIPEEICKCFHYSYCMPYEKLVEKLNTFGHAREIKEDWLKRVWPEIKPGVVNFHPVDPQGWKGIKEVEIPIEIQQLFQSYERG